MSWVWTDEKIELLKTLHVEGLSASLIAHQLGGGDLSRSAVIGKIHRLGLARRTKTLQTARRPRPERPKPEPKPKAAPAEPKGWRAQAQARVRERAPTFAADVYEPPVEDLVIPLAERKQLVNLEPNDCRYPIGDPVTKPEEFGFCARPKVPGLPYCEHHALRCYQPPSAKAAMVNPKPFVFTPMGARGKGQDARGEALGGEGSGQEETRASEAPIETEDAA